MSDKKHGNPLLEDRRSHMNSNGFVLGTSGAGKSFNVKAEMADMFLDRTFDKPIVLDPVSLGDRGGVGAVKPDNAVASSTAGRTKAPPIRRSSAHSPIRVGLSAPSSSARESGSEPFQRCSISSARSDQTSCASASSRTGPPTGSSGSTR